MLKIIIFCIVFFSESIFANNCSSHDVENKKTFSFVGQVANVGPDHSMKVVIRNGEESFYLLFRNKEEKNFFHQNNYRKFEIIGYKSDPNKWPTGIVVLEYKLLD